MKGEKMEAIKLKTYTLQEVLKHRIDELQEEKLWELYAITNKYNAERMKAEREAQIIIKGV